MSYEHTISEISKGVELAGVALLIVGGLYSLGGFTWQVARRRATDAYDDLRRTLGRSILVGLEVLVAADIIRTIAVSPSFTSVGVLGLVLLFSPAATSKAMHFTASMPSGYVLRNWRTSIAGCLTRGMGCMGFSWFRWIGVTSAASDSSHL